MCVTECADPSFLLCVKTDTSRKSSVGRVVRDRVLSRDGTVSFNLKKRNACGWMSLSMWGEKPVVWEVGKLETFFIYCNHKVYNEIMPHTISPLQGALKKIIFIL